VCRVRLRVGGPGAGGGAGGTHPVVAGCSHAPGAGRRRVRRGRWELALLLAEPLWPGEGTARFDRTVLPLTREAFWARLAMPDRFQVEAEGAIVVRALLPHLSWGTAHALLVGEDRWSAVALPAAIEKGRLIHWYRLMPCLDPHAPAGTPLSSPPSPRLYQEEVREAVEREWTPSSLLRPGFPACCRRRSSSEPSLHAGASPWPSLDDPNGRLRALGRGLDGPRTHSRDGGDGGAAAG